MKIILIDAYSFKVLWELLTRKLPFKGLESFQIAYSIIERGEVYILILKFN